MIRHANSLQIRKKLNMMLGKTPFIFLRFCAGSAKILKRMEDRLFLQRNIYLLKRCNNYQIIPSSNGSITTGALMKWRHGHDRSEEHTSELQSQFQLVCRL